MPVSVHLVDGTYELFRALARQEAIPDDPARWGVEVRGRERLASALAERRDEAALYRRLATLRTDVPLAEGLDELEWRGARRGELTALCREIGADDLLSRVPRWRD